MKKIPKTILVVDDEPGTVRMLEKILKLDGYHVIKAFNGTTGFKMAKSELPFLILLDVLMPDMDGKQVARLLRASPATKNIPIIFLTVTIKLEDDKGDETITIDGIEYRAMAKPMHTRKLLSMIRKAVNKRFNENPKKDKDG